MSLQRCLVCGDSFWSGGRPGDSEDCKCGRNLTRTDLQDAELRGDELSLAALRQRWQDTGTLAELDETL